MSAVQVAAVLVIAGAAHAQPVVLGPLPARANEGGLSGDGRFVVAGANHPPLLSYHPYRWSESAGFEFLSTTPGIAMDASFDGATVVGRVDMGLSGSCEGSDEAFRWTAEAGVVGLGWLPNGACPDSAAWTVSNDGTVVAGGSSFGPSFGVPRGFRWTEVGGIELLDVLSGDVYGSALGISADGSTIVGMSNVHAVQWTVSGVAELAPLAGYAAIAKAVAASADGSVVAGTGYGVGNVAAATRWVAGVPQNLGDLPGNSVWAEATGISADGTVVVGHSSATGGTGVHASKAFYWTPELGMRALTDVLAQDFGMDVSDLRFELAVAVSDDGRSVLVRDDTGSSDLWLVRLPAIPGRPACDDAEDDDDDGLVDHPADPGCQSASSNVENPKCDDDLDNDGDGAIDFDGGPGGAPPDPQCAAQPWRTRESPGGCGLGAEIALALAVLRRARR